MCSRWNLAQAWHHITPGSDVEGLIELSDPQSAVEKILDRAHVLFAQNVLDLRAGIGMARSESFGREISQMAGDLRREVRELMAERA